MENKRILFAEANEKADWQFRTKKNEKIHQIYRNDLRSFALRNYSESYKINRPLCGSLEHRRIMPSAERLSSKFHSCTRSFASRLTVHFFYFCRRWRAMLVSWVSLQMEGKEISIFFFQSSVMFCLSLLFAYYELLFDSILFCLVSPS